MSRRTFLPIVLGLMMLACSMPALAGPAPTPVVVNVVATRAAPPAPAEPAGLIVYTCFLDGYDQICLMNLGAPGPADGSNQRRLTTTHATDFYPSLAPGGGFIVFSSRRDGQFNIYRMDVDGNNQTRLTNQSPASSGPGDNYAPAVSPDGMKIVYISTAGGSQDVWLMGVDGSGPARLTDWPGEEYDPTWSPDGSRIAFTGDRSGVHELYVMDASGANVRQVTNGSGQRESGRNDWSPDGLTLSFYAGLISDKNIFTVPADCAGCTPDRFGQLTSGGNNKAPSYSPDGGWIVFAAGNATGDKNNDIYIMRVDGSDRRQLTHNPYAEWQPRWGANP
jgi:TolB protein